MNTKWWPDESTPKLVAMPRSHINMSISKFPVPDSYFERTNWRYGFSYVDAWYASYPAYVAALTRLGW